MPANGLFFVISMLDICYNAVFVFIIFCFHHFLLSSLRLIMPSTSFCPADEALVNNIIPKNIMSKNDHNSDHDNSDHNNSNATTASADISSILAFLGCRTSSAWLTAACHNLPLILQDHANCEKKAAGTAMNLIFRYEFNTELQKKLAQLIREEMLHYEQVLALMAERGLSWSHLPAGRYAKGMLKHKRTHEPAAMIDVLIIGAFIEARSCERFAALAQVVEDERLARYYRHLLKSESRHYEDYLALANAMANTTTNAISHKDINDRVAFFREVEADLISTPDDELRFHSGIPI